MHQHIFAMNLDSSVFDSYLERAGLEKKTHQYEAVAWCLDKEKNGVDVGNDKVVKGGLIADEMGLGKTIQILGTIVSNFMMRTLIVLPVVLLEQWNEVIYKTLGHRALIYHGAYKKKITLDILKSAPIVLTTYGLIAYSEKDPGKNSRNLLFQVNWGRVVYDEAHHLRNKNTSVHIGSLFIKAKIRWLITGTPIQNSKRDFFSICASMGLPDSYYKKSGNLIHLVKNFVLRRTKAEVGIQLPDMRVTTKKIKWKSREEKFLAEEIHSILPSISNLFRSTTNMMCSVLETIIYARQSCIYPALMASKLNKLTTCANISDRDERMLIEATHKSSKLDSVVETIKERKDNGNKKLVFCHFRGEIDEIYERLIDANIDVTTFDGRTLMRERKAKLENPVDVLIVQIQTACEGLNLQAYNEVYFVSPHWNPSVEDQAVARCHRIGQTREVEVFKFQMSGEEFGEDEDEDEDEDEVEGQETRTLEEYCVKKQDMKRKLREIIENPSQENSEVSS